MIEISAAAAMHIKQTRAANGLPDDYGLRVDRSGEPDDARLRLRFAPAPQSDDQVTEIDGLRVFVAAAATAPQVRQTIDTEKSESGMQLVLRRSAGPPP